MSELPQGWTQTTLDELCIFNPRHDPQTDRSLHVSFIPMSAVSDTLGIIQEHHQTRTLEEIWKGYTHFRDSDVIFAKIASCMENGKIAVANGLNNGLACGSTEFHVLRTLGGVSPQLLWYFLRQKRFREEAERKMTGAVQRRVQLSYLKQTGFCLPPLAEQRRIVAKLDSLFARTRRAREELAHIPLLVDHYKQAILTAAFRGDLTADWRLSNDDNHPSEQLSQELEASRHTAWQHLVDEGALRKRYKQAGDFDWCPDINLPDGWAWASVDQLVALVQYGSSAKTSEDPSGVPVLRMGNIQNGALDYSSLKYLPEDHAEFPTLLLNRGDVLFNRTNSAELVGKTAVFEGNREKVSFASYLIRLRACGIDPELLSGYINSPYGRDWVATVVSQQVGQANVNGTKLRRLGVPVMPRAKQREIVRRIRAAFDILRTIEQESGKATGLLAKLDQAALTKAFRGELVTQDPNDEPASALLERIRADREAQPKPRRGRRSAVAH